MHVVVTGGAGFIGSTLVDRLLAESYTVDVVDDLSTGSLANLGQARREGAGSVRFHQADVLEGALAELAARRRPDVIFHLAGPSAKVPRGPAEQVRLEVLATVAVLEAAARAETAKVVWAASARDQVDALRSIPSRAAHEYLEVFRERHGVEHTTLVLPTVYGPRQRPVTVGSVVAVFAQRVQDGEPCVIHGDGSQTRDLLYVDDAVDAFVRAVSRGDGEVVEIGSGEQVTISALRAAVAQVLAPDEPQPEPVPGPARPGEPGAVPVDAARAEAVLGWRAWTDLATGLAHLTRGPD